MDLNLAIQTSASGMRAQSTRMRVISENIANSQSLAKNPDEDPYRRQMVTFRNELDRVSGAKLVNVQKVVEDKSEFKQKYDPLHPAANPQGYVNMPNVNVVLETMDMQQAQRSYEANIASLKAAQNMLVKTIDLLNNR